MLPKIQVFLICAIACTALAAAADSNSSTPMEDGATDCDRIGCTREYDPVCGSDGHTYGNKCMFRVGQCRDPTLTMQHEGECEAPRSSCTQYCTMDYTPVCGSDGKTYSNSCLFDVAKCEQRDASMHIVHQGECDDEGEWPSECPQMCTMEYRPVCGSDGETYGNVCAFNVAKCQKRDADLTIAHQGECEDEVEVEWPTKCPRFCPMVHLPVCASDGQTYSNTCFFNIARCNKRDATMKIVHPGACKAESSECPRFCTMDYQPVCGSDGHTYSNTCMFSAHRCKTRDTSLTIVHDGECASRHLRR